MTLTASSGATNARPRLFQTAVTSTLSQVEQQDRYLSRTELEDLNTFFTTSQKRLEIAAVLTQNCENLISKAASRIFTGGTPMAFYERPKDTQTLEVGKDGRPIDLKRGMQLGITTYAESGGGNLLDAIKAFFAATGVTSVLDQPPPNFRPINIARYGEARMRKSLRDIAWFLRYTTYALVAGDPNILAQNTRGLREILEKACSLDATLVALQTLKQGAVNLFIRDAEAVAIIKQYFDVAITEFKAQEPSDKVRQRNSTDLQGLYLPQIYFNTADRRQKFVMKPGLSASEKNEVVRAAYRQIFERDISRAYSLGISDLESKVKNGEISMREFVRRLGKSPLYRDQFFLPFINSRALELAFKHFLGRAPESREEVQKYFAIVSKGGLPALIDALVDSTEYSDYFGEETVPYQRGLGQEAQPCRNWGAQFELFNYSAPFRKVPQFITLFASYNQPLPDQHVYGSGNDPLEIQFGAIFPKERKNPSRSPAPFGKDTRRILIRNGPGILNQVSAPDKKGVAPGTLGPRVFKLDQLPLGSKFSKGGKSAPVQGVSVKFAESSTQAVIRAIYQQVIGRQVYEGQRLKVAEIKLENGEITVKEFVRTLAKSPLFRDLYWTKLYVCKAIEYIHRRLLGRPTYGRQEMNAYYDICAKKGFYALVDAIIDSQEYNEAFGEDTVPYERYLTPAGYSLRQNRPASLPADRGTVVEKEEIPRFIELGQVTEERSLVAIGDRIKQGVSKLREQRKIFKLTSTDPTEVQEVARAAVRQVFERDMSAYVASSQFSRYVSALQNREITVKELILALGTSELYIKEFYSRYPNTKVIELGTKHFLGRAPLDQAEIRKYNIILATKGLRAMVTAMVNSAEYQEVFGEDTVPYNRFATFPAGNFVNTQKLYAQLTKQSKEIVVPSFRPVQSRLDLAQTPLVSAKVAEMEANRRKPDPKLPRFIQLGLSYANGNGQSVEAGVGTFRRKPQRIFRHTKGTNSPETAKVINAIYTQVMDVFSGKPPEQFRVTSLESRLKNGEISVREFVRELACSEQYRKRFYTPYPNTKVVELLFKHILGRAPATQAEVRQYNKLLAEKGLRAAVEAMVNSEEYAMVFGEDVVPYKRYPSLPAGNYLGSLLVDRDLIKQSWSDYSPAVVGGRAVR